MFRLTSFHDLVLVGNQREQPKDRMMIRATNSAVRVRPVTAGLCALALFACTYDYDKYEHDSTDSAGRPAASGGADSTLGQGGGSSEDGGSPPTTGGSSDSGDSSSGSSASVKGSGGESSLDAGGATNALAGNSSFGGATATGGSPVVGGMSGATETGGAITTTGGKSPTGGAITTTGGKTSTGGATATGGTSSPPVTSCDAPLTLCGSTCSNLNDDATHCGQCTTNCTTIQASFACYSGTCGCSLPASCGSGTVNCVNHLCVCGTSTTPCSAGQVCIKKGSTYSCGAN